MELYFSDRNLSNPKLIINEMKNLSIALVLTLFCSVAAFAQMRVPAPSPSASVSQVVGATKISIDYSAPGVRDRKIWGGLLPYDKIWRAGANSATSITFQDDAEVAGEKVEAGSYSLFITPKKEGAWSVYLDPSGKSVFNYDQDEDKVQEAEGVIMLEAEPKMVDDSKEHLAYHINPLDQNTAHIVLRWENLMLPMEVKVNTVGVASKSIESQLGDWYAYANAAKYYAENDLDLDKAQTWTEMSVENKDHFYNKWVMAMIMNKKGNTEKAIEYAEAAKEYGEEKPSNFYNSYKEEIEASLKEWK